VIQAKSLKCRLYGVVQMKSENTDKENVDDRIPRIGEKKYGHPVKVMLPDTWRRADKTYLDKVEVNEMEKKKKKNNDSTVKHVAGKRRCF